jgi:hypothetical protein
MSHFIFLAFLFAQEPFSPEKYQEQTSHCDFSGTNTLDLTSPIDKDFFLDSQIPQMTRRYPLSTPWINQESFLEKLSEVLYKNEADCKIENLTHWNSKEDFPSIGLPHAIWYPAHIQKKYQEQFPELIYFIQKNLKHHEKTKLTWPLLLNQKPLGAAPWKTQKDFAEIQKVSLKIEIARDSTELISLKKEYASVYANAYELFEIRHFLANPIVLRLQAKFVVEKTLLSLYRILAAAEKESPQKALLLQTQINRLLRTPEGVLSLVDYLNFKGEGIKSSERTPVLFYSWGLKSTLEIMSKSKWQQNECNEINKNDGACASRQFAQAVLCSLQRLAQYSGAPGSAEQLQRYAWLNGGWKKRIESNYTPGTFSTPRCQRNPASIPKPVTADAMENL